MDWYHSQSFVSLGPGQKSSTWHILPSVIQPDLTDPTLMALRAFLQFRLDAGTTTGTGFVALGIIAWSYVTDAAPTLAADTPSVMSPDGDMDWIARWVSPVLNGTNAGTLLSPNIFDNTHLVKARRRLGNDRSLLIVYESVNLSASIALDLRTLIKE